MAKAKAKPKPKGKAKMAARARTPDGRRILPVFEDRYFIVDQDGHVLDGDRLQLLIQGFACGMTDEEAALYAGISRRNLYNAFKANPVLREHTKRLKGKPVLDAKITLAQAVQVDGKAALELLERLERTTYGKAQTVDLNLFGSLNLGEMSDAELTATARELADRLGLLGQPGTE